MKFIDLCSGIGGFRLGLEVLGGKCVFSCEKDKFAQKTYLAWYGDDPTCDLTTLDPVDIPEYDILTGGFPCVAFSSAGLKQGFNDPRGMIFFNIASIIRQTRPKAVILENVKGLVKHDNGKTLHTIQDTLDKLGYNVFVSVLSASHWVPQNRERLFIVCLDRAKFPTAKALNFPKLPPTGPPLSSILEKKVDPKYTLKDGTWKFLQKHKAFHAKVGGMGNGFGYTVADLNSASRTLTSRYHKDGAEILIANNKGNPRKLTPRECARLMGFPDRLPIVVSDTQAYKQFGNAVVPQCVTFIASSIIRLIK